MYLCLIKSSVEILIKIQIKLKNFQNKRTQIDLNSISQKFSELLIKIIKIKANLENVAFMKHD